MTGTHTVVANVTITRPAYDVVHPAEVIYQTSFEVLHTLEAEGFMSPAPTQGTSFDLVHKRTGAIAAEAWVKTTGSPAGAVTTLWTKSLSGLVAGRSYTFEYYASVWGLDSKVDSFKAGVKFGAAAVVYGSTVTATTSWKRAAVTFTATAAAATLVIAGTEASEPFSLMNVDDVKLTQEPWSEHFPAVTTSDVVVDVKTCQATLDDSWSPYGQVELECWRPAEEVLQFVDPRTVPTPRLTVVLSDGTTSRTLRLTLRKRVVDHVAGTMTLTGETDEALLLDKVRVAATVDTTARQYASSLRTLINAVVLAPIGAVLAADAGATADLTVYEDQANLVPNPSAETNTTGWTPTALTLARTASAMAGVTGANVFRCSAPTAAVSFIQSDLINVTAGKTYVVSAAFAMVTTAAGGTQDSRARRIQIIDAGGAAVAQSVQGSGAIASALTRLDMEFVAPAGNSQVRVRLWLGSTVGEARWDAVKLAEKTGAADADYFDGDTADTAAYQYDWTAAAHASSSTRTNVSGADRDPKMFDQLPGQSLWDFVDPLVQAGGLRLFCDDARVWHLVDPVVYSVPGLLQVNAGTNAKEATDEISRYGDWFDSVVIRYQWNDADGITQTRYDFAGVAPSKTVYIEKSTAWPGPGAAVAMLKRSASRGRVLDLTAVSSYAAAPSMALQSQLPASPLQRGVVSAIEWRIPDDEMTVKSRELGDVASSAWQALAAGQSWNASPVGASWIAEAV